MSTAEVTFSKDELVSIKHPMQYIGIDWETDEQISVEIGESRAVELFYKKGDLFVMPVTEPRELLTNILHNFITFAAFAAGINLVPTGKATMRSEHGSYGVEPDLSYFVSKADIHQTKDYIPKEIELAPDIVCEIDVYHASEDKFEVYAGFGVSEFWLYDGERLKIFKLQANGEYPEIERSEEIPILTGAILSEFLRRGQTERQFAVLSDFQNWLQENK